MADANVVKLAKVLVNYSASVKKDQLVRITGPTLSLPLLTEIYRETLAAGAHPFVRISPEELTEILLKNGSDEQISFVNPISQFEIEKIDCTIGVWAESNTRSLTNIDGQKMKLSQSARRPIFKTFLDRSAANTLNWTGTQYPTQASAQDAEMSLAEYEHFVYSAGLLFEPDPAAAWRKLSERQQKLADFLNGKSDYHVVAANGTDVRMSVAGRTWLNSDGRKNFPDGEVFTGPVLDSVNGTICFSFPAVHHGREVLDVKLTFKDGKVVDASASKGREFLYAMLDTDAGSRFLGECAIGTNFSITRFTRNTLFDEKIGGTVHFAIGSGYPETGNNNQSSVHWDMVVDLRTGGFIEIDGVKINIDGRFTRPEFPQWL